MSFDSRITGSNLPPSSTVSGTGGTTGAQKQTNESKIDTTPPTITYVEKEGEGGAEPAKPDASKPVLDKGDLPDSTSTDTLNSLIDDASKKMTEGDPGVIATLSATEGDEQTIQEMTAATYKRLNDNSYLKEAGIQIGDDGITMKDETTGEQRPLSTMNVNPNLIQQMILGILLQDLRDQRAEAAGDRQKYLQDQVANNIMSSINKQIESDKSKASGADSSKAGEVIGWIGAILTEIVGVLTGNPGLIAAGILAITMMALQSSGGMEKITTAFAKSLEDSGMSKQAAQIFASVFLTVVIAGVTLALTFGAGASETLTNLAESIRDTIGATLKGAVGIELGTKEMADIVAKAGKVATLGVTAAQGGTQVASSVYEYKAGKAQAESMGFEAQAQDLDFNIQQMTDFLKAIITGGSVMKTFSKEMQTQYSTLGGIYGNIA